MTSFRDEPLCRDGRNGEAFMVKAFGPAAIERRAVTRRRPEACQERNPRGKSEDDWLRRYGDLVVERLQRLN
jgi:hypothetical protein